MDFDHINWAGVASVIIGALIAAIIVWAFQ